MRSESPGRLRHWWWSSSTSVRLLPAAGLVMMALITVLAGLSGPSSAVQAQPARVTPRTPSVEYAPLPTAETPDPPQTSISETPAPTPESPAPTTTTKPRTTSAERPTRTWRWQGWPLESNPGQTGPGNTSSRSSTSVREGSACSNEGGIGRSDSGQTLVCTSDKKGNLRWTSDS